MLLERKRWPLVALVVSLGGNLFLGGWVAGGGFGHFPPMGPPPGPDRLIERLAEGLPSADATLLRDAAARNREAFIADNDRRRTFPDRMRAILREEPFDAAKMEVLLREEEDRETANRQRFTTEMIGVAKKLSPEARKKLADFRPSPGPGPGPGGEPGPR